METKRFFWGVLLLCTFHLSCTTKHKIKEYDFNTILKAKIMLAGKSSQPIKLNLCDEITFNWDSILILPPYSNAKVVRKQGLVNSKAIEEMLPELTLDEGKCVLLFIENNTVIKYSYVPRVPIDFNNIKKLDEPITKISRKIGCEQFYIKKNNNTFSLLDIP
ncbi:MAG: hypothetical protein WC622_00225 [Pedobacter sp.]|jgi:hypothetical protein|uniref:hypothetical protein n=1 Tax=Pedobacter sp. TaxID=1411316 RepID=UPI003569C256